MSGGRERLAELRKEAGYTQETLAAALNVHRRTVLRWERGSADPQPAQRKGLAEALAISTGELAEILRTQSYSSEADHRSLAAEGESAAIVPPLVDAEDAVGSGKSRWTRRHLRSTLLAAACGLAVITGLIVLRPADNPRVPAAGMAVSMPHVLRRTPRRGTIDRAADL